MSVQSEGPTIRRVAVFLAGAGRDATVRRLLTACRQRRRFDDATFIARLLKDQQVRVCLCARLCACGRVCVFVSVHAAHASLTCIHQINQMTYACVVVCVCVFVQLCVEVATEAGRFEDVVVMEKGRGGMPRWVWLWVGVWVE